MVQYSRSCCAQDKHRLHFHTDSTHYPSSKGEAGQRTEVSLLALLDNGFAWSWDHQEEGPQFWGAGLSDTKHPRALWWWWDKYTSCKSGLFLQLPEPGWLFRLSSLRAPQRVPLLWGTCLIKAATLVTWDRSLTSANDVRLEADTTASVMKPLESCHCEICPSLFYFKVLHSKTQSTGEGRSSWLRPLRAARPGSNTERDPSRNYAQNDGEQPLGKHLDSLYAQHKKKKKHLHQHRKMSIKYRYVNCMFGYLQQYF